MFRFLKVCCLYLLIVVLTVFAVLFIESQPWELSIKVMAYGVLAGVSGMLFILVQLKGIYGSIETERMRHRREVTMDMCRDVQNKVRQLGKELDEEFSMKRDSVKQVLEETDLRYLFTVGGLGSKAKVEELLGTIEQIGLGIRHNVYDIEIVRDYSANLFSQVYFKYEPFITKVRSDQVKTGQKVKSYEQFISLMKIC